MRRANATLAVGDDGRLDVAATRRELRPQLVRRLQPQRRVERLLPLEVPSAGDAPTALGAHIGALVLGRAANVEEDRRRLAEHGEDVLLRGAQLGTHAG